MPSFPGNSTPFNDKFKSEPAENYAKMYGGRWREPSQGVWTLHWPEDAIQDFYLNNILIHELGHLLDDRNSSYIDRERYAEWFAIEHGYRATGGGGVWFDSETLEPALGPVTSSPERRKWLRSGDAWIDTGRSYDSAPADVPYSGSSVGGDGDYWHVQSLGWSTDLVVRTDAGGPCALAATTDDRYGISAEAAGDTMYFRNSTVTVAVNDEEVRGFLEWANNGPAAVAPSGDAFFLVDGGHMIVRYDGRTLHPISLATARGAHAIAVDAQGDLWVAGDGFIHVRRDGLSHARCHGRIDRRPGRSRYRGPIRH